MVQFADIVGQDEAVGFVQRTLTSGRRPHALIFAGPAGVGRRTTAEALATALLCEQAASDAPSLFEAPEGASGAPDACGQCDDCRMMQAGSHPDYHVVSKELAAYHDDPQVRTRVMQALSIDVVRQFLIAPAAQAPTRGRAKVFIVREADLLSTPAQNALLKTLEEPHPRVTIVLLSERVDLLLPTTRSRCALVRFGPLPAAFVVERLVAAEVEKNEAAFWAAFTGASVGAALRLAEQGLYPIKQELLERLAQVAPGGDEDLGEWLAKLADKQAHAAVSASQKADGSVMSKTLATRQVTGRLLQIIASLYRDGLTAAAGIDRPCVNADQPACVERIAKRFDATQLADVIEQLSAFERMLWQNVNPKTVWDNVVLTCASAAPLRI